MAYNVSAIGTKITVDGKEITNFADDNTPFSVQPVETGGTAMTIKDTLLFYNRHNGVKIDISVIPDSVSDARLYQISREREQLDKGFEIVITTKDATYTYTGCFSINDNVGVEATNDGRFKGKTYSFMGEKADVNSIGVDVEDANDYVQSLM